MWYQNCYRRHLCDMHIDDWSEEFLSQFSPEEYVENLKLAKINSAMIYLQSHVGLCYFPTKVGKMHNAFIGDETKTKRLIELCKKEGIAVTGYYSLSYDTYQHDLHPEWGMVDQNGDSSRGGGDGEFAEHAASRYGHLCPNNPEYREYTKAQIKEMADFFPKMDGMFYDMLFWPGSFCFCDHCKKRWQEEVGGEMPLEENNLDPQWRLLKAKRREWMGEYAAWVTEETRKLMPWVSVQHNVAGSVTQADNGNAEEVLDACDYAGGDLYSGEVFGRLFYRKVTKNPPFEFMFSRCFPNLGAHTQIKSLDVMRSEVFKTSAHHGACLVIDAIDPVGTMDRRVYEQLGKVNEEVIPYEKYYYGTPVEDIGIYYSLKGKFAPFAGMQGKYKGTMVRAFGEKWSNREGALTTVDTCVQKHIPMGVTGGFAPLDHHQVVIIPATTPDDEYDTQRIVEYVRNGGKVYFSGGEHAGLLKAFFNAQRTGYTEERVVYIAPKDEAQPPFEYYNKKYPLRVEWFTPIVEGIPEEKVIAHVTLPYTKYHTETKFASIHSNPPGIPTNIPAMAVTQFGKGKVFFSAMPIECYDFYDYRNILVNLIDTYLGVERTVTSDAPEDVELVTFRADGEMLVSVVQHNHSYKARKVEDFSINVKCDFAPKAVYSLPEEKEIPSRISGNEISFDCKNLDMFTMFQIK